MSSAGLSNFKRHRQNEATPARGHKGDQGTGLSGIEGAERAWAVQPGEEIAQEDLIHVHKYLMEGCTED